MPTWSVRLVRRILLVSSPDDAWQSLDMFAGYQRRHQWPGPGRLALRLAVDTRTGRRPDSNSCWKRRPGRPRHTWVRQVEIDARVSADDAWDTTVDRCQWRALRPQLVFSRSWWWWCKNRSVVYSVVLIIMHLYKLYIVHFIFTARCYTERGYATVCRLTVRPSVTFRYRDHIGWNTSKI